MRTRRLLLTLLVASGAAFLSRVGHSQIRNQTQTSAALTGQVTSTEEGLMEGVLVTVKKTGSTIAITVATDEQGRYRFPPGRLEPGHYAISIRAVGYDLDGPTTVDISAPNPSTADLKLRKTANLSMQLTNAEWIESVPGTPEQKSSLRNCVTCHTLQRPIRSAHDADEFVQVQQRMANYVNQSIPEAPQTRLAERLANQQERGEEDGQSR
jgi:virginiamycin B lyase